MPVPYAFGLPGVAQMTLDDPAWNLGPPKGTINVNDIFRGAQFGHNRN